MQVGACCVQGVCIDGLPEVECVRMGGSYAGDGTQCSDNPC
jgi:hypothetical protein